MSFTSEVKENLLLINNDSTCCELSFLAGMMCFTGNVKIGEHTMSYSFSSENPKITEKIDELVKKNFGSNTVLRAKGAGKTIIIEDAFDVLYGLGIIKKGDIGFSLPDELRSDCCRRSFVRGAFLAGGSVTAPQKRYHLEFVTPHFALNGQFQSLFSHFDIPSKWLIRKSKYVTYFKDNEIISDVLAMIGATDAVIEINITNMEKSIRNDLNRQSNCDFANMDKTIAAGFEQAKAIKKIGLDNLPENLKALAKLRLENKELSLADLGQLLEPPISKSAVNHRMRKIMEIAKGN